MVLRPEIRKVTVIFLFFISACSSGFWKIPDKLVLSQVSFSDLPDWHKLDMKGAIDSFIKTCPLLGKNKNIGNIYVSSDSWEKVCKKASVTENARLFFEENFKPYLAANHNNTEGLFTGYYHIELKGSRKKHKAYRYPIYKMPKSDYNYSRYEIESGALLGKGLEIAYVDDSVQLFFLHIQGSGIIHLDDGKPIYIGFAGKNDRPYIAIGKFMAEQGLIDKKNVTAQTIKAWLYKNPDKAQEIMNQNPSYIFFKELKKNAAVGASGAELVPEVSLAIDKDFLPYGIPLWLATDINGKSYNRLMITQDTGSAIKGPIRGDIFFGRGKNAEKLAGEMKQKGRYYILLPKNE